MSGTKLRLNRNPSTKALLGTGVEGDLVLGKIPPHSIELEEAVLGALMIDKHALGKVIEFLKPTFFYSDQHALIYQAMLDLREAFKPIDVRTVSDKLQQNGNLKIVGYEYLIDLTTKISSSANVEYHARIVHEKYLRRYVYQLLIGFASQSYEEGLDIFDLVTSLERDVFDINVRELQVTNIKDGKTLGLEFIRELERRSKLKDGLTGIPSGFTSLDRVTHGWQPSDLIIIAARPGMGKTSWILTSIRSVVVDFKIPTAVFSLEMSSLQLISRLYSIDTNITGEALKRSQLNPMQLQAVHNSPIASSHLFVDDTPGLKISQLLAKLRRLVAQSGVKIAFVDYLQLMQIDAGEKTNREQEIAKISRSLKQIAKECNIPIIAISQLSRGVETRGGDKRPQLSDLRESGAIEQDADIVMFLYRPEYYKITIDEDGMPTANQAEVIIAKHRNGSTGSVKLHFIGRVTKFTDQATPSTLI